MISFRKKISELMVSYSMKRNVLPIAGLLLVYFLLRLTFQQLSVLKTAFIYPTGLVVEIFYGFGEYINTEWLFGIEKTQFILGESCSGTTFFSLLVSYIFFRIYTHRVSFLWLAIAFPITITVNSMRVLSSIYAHETLLFLDIYEYSEQVHVITGTVAFLISFLIVAYIIEKPKELGDHAV